MKNAMTTLLIFISTLGARANMQEEILDGRYSMKLKVGEKVFNDEMELKGASGPILVSSFSGNVQGAITVPGVFTSPLDGDGLCTSWGQQCFLEFTIVAKENGRSYKVRYEAALNRENYRKVVDQKQQPVLTGSAYFENGEMLGTFEAVRTGR